MFFALHLVAMALGFANAPALSAVQSDTTFILRPSLTAGMGVAYHNSQDIVEMINGTYSSGQRVSEFNTSVDFFGSFCYPLSRDWALKLEYSYLLTTYNVPSNFGPGEFTAVLHLPTLFVQYIVVASPLYNIKAGLGAGLHFGTLSIRYGTLDDSYRAAGPGMAMEVEGNTAFAEHVFVQLGVNARWEFVGALKNAADRAPGVNVRGDPVSMHQFGVGARIGFSYVF